MAPKAFISHASEDKERFVLPFAQRLRELGVDAWLDKWEMNVGDSLVDRIFEEGIKNADAFVIVLSSNSVDKPWVREELNAGFVKRISGQCKLIPLIIDTCDVPECLASTLWERVRSLDDIEDTCRKIANTIHGICEKPAVGPPPRHVSTAIDVFPQLDRQDQIVLALACRQTMETGWPIVDYPSIHPQLTEQGLTRDEILESLQVLDGRHFISVQWVLGGGISHFEVSLSTFETYLKTTLSDYPLMINEICLQILNRNRMSNTEIQQATGLHPRVVNHVLSLLQSRGLLEIVTTLGGGILVLGVSPELSRRFRDRNIR